MPEGHFLNHRRRDRGSGHHRKVRNAIANRIYCLRGGMVADFEPDTGIHHSEFFQHRKQDAVQCNLACRDKNGALFKIAAPDDFRLARLDALERDADMLIQPLPFARQLHSAIVPDKQRASQLALKRFDRPGQIRLIVQQNLCRAGDIPILGYIVKNPVIVVTDIHFRTA